jgi:SPOR domain
MPNLNLKDDELEETPPESIPPSMELTPEEPQGRVGKTIPFVTGGLLALVLAGFILNKSGIIHLWGVQKTQSVVVAIPAETEGQILSDSAMTAQFAIDSAQQASGTNQGSSGDGTQHAAAVTTQAEEMNKAGAIRAKTQAEEKNKAGAIRAKSQAEEKNKAGAIAAKSQAEEKNKAGAIAAKSQADEKKKTDEAEAKKKAEEKKNADAVAAARKAEEKKKGDIAEAQQAAEKKKLADAEKKNMTYVEVPGYTPRRSGAVVESKQISRAVTPQTKAPVKPERVPPAAAQRKPEAKNTAAQVKPEKTHTAATAPALKSEGTRTSAQKRTAVQDSVKKNPARQAAATISGPKAHPDTSAGRAVGDGKYSVQISSWADEAKALAQARQFTGAGIQAFVSQSGRIYRVCIGRYASRDAALARAEELAPMLETKYNIIQVK